MKFADILAAAWHNLLRMRLRTSLTTAGVVIAIAAFVAMLSFGAGNQRLVSEQYARFGLLFTMQVYPLQGDADSTVAAVLDDGAVLALGRLPGVRLAYPLESFPVRARIGDSTVETDAQVLSVTATQTRQFSQLAAGATFASDTVQQALVSSSLLRSIGWDDPDSAIGRPMEVTVRLITIDSALFRVIRGRDGRLHERFRSIRFDSLVHPDYMRRTTRAELGTALERFLDGLLNARRVVTDTVEIVGVLESRHVGRGSSDGIILPLATGRGLTAGGLSDNPTDLFAQLAQGRLPGGVGTTDGRSYRRVTLDLEPEVPYRQVRDTVEALGFRTFSFAEQFDEIRQFFFYFDLALGLIGLIALVTASLGIANTLLMAIMERRREIGVLKSLGADDRDIRLLFVMESSVIGAIGATLGIVVGWLISRAGSLVARTVMEHRGLEPADFFAVPLWLVLAALAVGIGVSLAAGYYPASRAARLDPVECLRAE